MDVKLKHICSLGGGRGSLFGGWRGQMPIIGQSKNKKASSVSRGFCFSALYSSGLKENTKNWDDRKNSVIQGVQACKMRKMLEGRRE